MDAPLVARRVTFTDKAQTAPYAAPKYNAQDANEQRDVTNNHAGFIDELFDRAPNSTRGADKRVRFLTNAQLAADPYGGDSLEGIPNSLLCLGMEAWVELHPDGYGTTLKLVFDGEPRVPALSGLRAYRTGHMVAGDIVAAKWVPAGSPEAQVGGGAQFNPLATFYKGADADGPAAVVLYAIGELRPWEVVPTEGLTRADFPNNRIPAPTGQPDDPYWREKPLAAPKISISQLISVGQARAIVAQSGEATFTPGFTYRINPRIDKSSGSEVVLPDVIVEAATRSTLKLDEAYEVPAGASGPITPVSYDLTTDATGPRNQGSSPLGAPVVVRGESAATDFATLPAALADGLTDLTLLLNRGIYTIPGLDLVMQEGVMLGNAALIDLASDSTFAVSNAALQNVFFQNGTVILQNDPSATTLCFACAFRSSNALQVPATYQGILADCIVEGSLEVAGTLVLRAGTTVPPGYLAGLTNNGDGTYTTPDGGTVVDERGAGGPTGAGLTTLVIDSTTGQRVSKGIPILDPLTIQAEILDTNASAVSYQLDKNTRVGTRVYGDPNRTLSQVNVLLAAVTPTERENGVKLYALTTATNDANPATIILRLQ